MFTTSIESVNNLLIILNGPAGCGKGTIANSLKSRYGFKIIGAGEELRAYIKDAPDTCPLKSRIQARMSQGLNVDTKDLYQIIEQKLTSTPGKLIGDGVVRAIDQAMWLRDFANKTQKLIHFVNLTCPIEVLIARLSSRYFVPGDQMPYSSYDEAMINCPVGVTPITRDDDKPDVVKARLKLYEENVKPILDILHRCDRVLVDNIDANRSPEVVLNEIVNII
jgi:adenylate kinase